MSRCQLMNASKQLKKLFMTTTMKCKKEIQRDSCKFCLCQVFQIPHNLHFQNRIWCKISRTDPQPENGPVVAVGMAQMIARLITQWKASCSHARLAEPATQNQESRQPSDSRLKELRAEIKSMPYLITCLQIFRSIHHSVIKFSLLLALKLIRHGNVLVQMNGTVEYYGILFK